MSKQQHVIVVGGGLIGLCSAYSLLERGHRVTVVERTELGSGAALGNAGEVTPLQVTPLASPSLIKDIARGILTRSSYLSISRTRLPSLTPFGLGFLRASSRGVHASSMAALSQFAPGIFPSFDAMQQNGIDVSGGGSGFLFTSDRADEIRAMHTAFAVLAEERSVEGPGQVLVGDELREAEPVLSKQVHAGFMLPSERYISPVRFVKSLSQALIDRGATVMTGVQATGLKARESGAEVVVIHPNGSRGTVVGDSAVIASGIWTRDILKNSGVRARMASGKGYSFTVPMERRPKSLVLAVDRHLVAVPMDDTVRIVGIMEFDDRPEQLNRDRIEFLVNKGRDLFVGADWDNRTEEWSGPRPMTPNGLPYLGAIRGFPNTFVATGHNMHGLSLGPITGDIIGQLVDGEEPTVLGEKIDLSPFALPR